MTLINMVSHTCVVLHVENVLSQQIVISFSSFMVPCTVIDIKLLCVNRWQELGRAGCVHDRVGSLVQESAVGWWFILCLYNFRLFG